MVISTERIDIDGEDCYLGVVVDVTDQRRADEALLASEIPVVQGNEGRLGQVS